MTWEDLRAACLEMQGSTETFPFEPGCSVFKAPNGKMFAVSVTTSEPLDVSVKCDPGYASALRRDYEAVAEGYHLNKKHWITVAANVDVPDDRQRRRGRRLRSGISSSCSPSRSPAQPSLDPDFLLAHSL